jgi:EAL and modified HD-GYP domain-containing signal transduction protein
MEKPLHRRPALAVGSDLGLMLALRPVHTSNLEVMAYDPIFQSLDGRVVTVDDYIALGLVLSEGYSSLQGSSRSVPFFIRISSSIIRQIELPFFPAERFVLDVLPSPTDHHADLELYRHLADSGYRIAINLNCPDPPSLPLYLEFATALKIDVTRLRGEALLRLVNCGKERELELICVGLSSRRDFDELADMGFKGFAGDLFGRLEQSSAGRLPESRLLLFELLTELQRVDANLNRIEELVARQPGLMLRILTLVNSASIGSRQEVNSVSSAIRLLGLAELRRWVSLLVLADNADAPQELIRITLVRARMCELLARAGGLGDPDTYFLTGLLSTIDAITGIPLHDAMAQLPIGTEIKNALLQREGERGQILREVSQYQEGLFPSEDSSMPVTCYEPFYRQSTAWARDILDCFPHA